VGAEFLRECLQGGQVAGHHPRVVPPVLQVMARLLPLTYLVEALQGALAGRPFSESSPDLLALAACTALLFALATLILRRRVE